MQVQEMETDTKSIAERANTEELLPLLDILMNLVKAIRCLRELLTTKRPPKTFSVKVRDIKYLDWSYYLF